MPRWTPLHDMVEYQTYDVTESLQTGDNIIGMAIGDGRYRGRGGVGAGRRCFGDRLAGFAQFEVDLADGASIRFVTDSRWHAGPGRIVGSDPKFGERVDLRIPDSDWLSAPVPPARFQPAQPMPATTRRLVAEEVERVRQVERLAATVRRAPSGKQIIDFGQNFAGVARIRLDAPAGTRVVLTHSELLTPEGELDESWIWTGLGKWYQRDEVTLGDEPAWFQPWFTIHGFRYVEVDGLDGTLADTEAEGIVLSSDLPPAGSFTCSDPRLNRLHRNVLWSLRSNFVDTPTDCPTRERAGWTGDIQVFSPASTRFVDGQAYLRRYLRNVAHEQHDDGTVPPWIPSDTPRGGRLAVARRFFRWTSNAVGWGDVTVILPWNLYRYYGDRTVLERQYDSMQRWVAHLEREARTKRGRARWLSRRLGDHDRYIIGSGFHWGEWLRPGEGPLSMVATLAVPRAVVATAYFAHSTRLLSAIAQVLGHEADSRRYAELSEKVRAAWRAAFVRPDWRIGDDKQDDYVRALAFDLLLDEQRPAATARLVRLIEEAGDHLGTGFLSTPMLLPTLVTGGRADVALRLLFQTTSPSWLYQVERGATTVWETWEGYDSQGRGRMSHNHYAFGSVAGWLFEGIAGLSPAEPGYRRIRVSPVIGGGLTGAAGTVETPFGPASSTWCLEDGTVRLRVEVPPGTSADVHVGDGGTRHVGSGSHTFEWTYGGP